MKKTEKIEVRLSHEEKTALTTLAEQEGRTVSELVRGLVERYMSCLLYTSDAADE